MTTDAQETPGGVSTRRIEANRRNAELSTGPRTLRGRKKAAQNSLRHGLLSRQMVVLGERTRDLMKLWREIHDAYRPVGPIEKLLVDRIASAAWRLRRFGRVEGDIFCLREGDGRSQHRDGQAFLGDCFVSAAFPKLSRYEKAIEEALYRAVAELKRAQEARKSTANALEMHAKDTASQAVFSQPNGAEVPTPQVNGAG